MDNNALNDGVFVMSEVKSIREAFAEASSFLSQSGCNEPQRSAQLLLEHVLGLSGAAYYMALADSFPAAVKEAWEAGVTRRSMGEPVQYIIGEQEFYGRPFEVTPDVLIPRPETELLVEAILRYGAELWPDGTVAPSEAAQEEDAASLAAGQEHACGAENVRVARPLTAVDIGAGSGAISVTLAAEAPAWRVYAGDISPAALAVAERNALRNGTAVDFRLGDLLEPFAGMETDILVSNPPYIPGEDIAGLQREVRDHEPRTALDGGADGLDPYRRMIEQLTLLPAPPRLIGFELGMGQAEQVAALLEAAGHWEEIITVNDLAGIPRHVLGIAR
ncbi:peptide chain release factor N(5)-glutamine methyltransferase [Paenibacillus etheri]|uniref:Release factor glutamine methyltransferase n=1 Tax=Paenibacillus etheri TaxID=1306852 RepID=A0A0W1ARL8_9BACL|nr:peptide chain release factor N(5)-glutamine methyltransferase [Paenibacillus etheri]KTD83906.1 protein-(glutamine-N5) methyltransferase, release factor-specific [Paenibacillus etheri]